MGKLFFNIIGKLGIVLCVCLTIMACADDMAEQVNNESSKATVNLTFNTRANEGDIDANEGIKTLRIIVTDEAGTILYNQKESGLGDVERHTVSIELPKTKVRFYVFANEESMGREFDTEDLESDGIVSNNILSSEKLLARAWDDENAKKAFPKQSSEIGNKGLPMTGYKGVQKHETYKDDGNPVNLTNKTVEQIEIPLIRCVVKIVVEITNQGVPELTVSGVNLGQFITDKVYYFQLVQWGMPDGAELETQDFSLSDIVIKQYNTATIFTGYIYPVAISYDSGEYSIALKSTGTNERDYKEFLRKSSSPENPFVYLPRNSRITIKGEVTGELTIDTEFTMIVDEWEDKVIGDIEFN